MVKELVKKISKGTRFNQIYLQKSEGLGFESGKTVIIRALADAIAKELPIFEYHVKLNSLKKEIVRTIFKIIGNNGDYGNIIITGSFLDEGFNFEDIDIVIINPAGIDKRILTTSIEQSTGINPHLIFIDMK